MARLKMGLPKGSLQEATFDLLGKAGWKISVGARSYTPSVNDEDLDVILIRAQEMSRYVEQGKLDVGLSGLDWTLENGSDVRVVCDLAYSKVSMRPVKWVLAVPETSSYRKVADLQGAHIATELVNVTRDYLGRHKVDATVEFSWGATEAKPPELADAIVEVTETGSSLRANNLRIIDVVLVSNTQIIANKDAWADPGKKRKIDEVAMLLLGAIAAHDKVGLKMNASKDSLDRILADLPALRRPTVSELSECGWFAIDTVVSEETVRRIVPRLKELGAEGIIEYPLNKIIE